MTGCSRFTYFPMTCERQMSTQDAAEIGTWSDWLRRFYLYRCGHERLRRSIRQAKSACFARRPRAKTNDPTDLKLRLLSQGRELSGDLTPDRGLQMLFSVSHVMRPTAASGTPRKMTESPKARPLENTRASGSGLAASRVTLLTPSPQSASKRQIC